MPEDTLTLETLLKAARDMRRMTKMRPRLLVPEAAYPSLTEHLARMEAAAPHEAAVFGGIRAAFHSFIGLQLQTLFGRTFRPPEKPLKSRPQRQPVRARRTPVQAERVRLKGEKRRSARYWKGRKVPDRTGYPPGTMFMYDPGAVFLNPWMVT